MNSKINFICPKCGSESFVSTPNRYDLLEIVNGIFEVVKSKFTEEEYKIFCRECSAEVDEESTLENKKIVLKITR